MFSHLSHARKREAAQEETAKKKAALLAQLAELEKEQASVDQVD